MNCAHPDLAEVSSLLRRSSWSEQTRFTRLSGGNRHKVYKLDDSGRSAVLKLYGAAGIAAREPFNHEAAVHGFFARHCPDSVPRILDLDEATRCVLFECVDGERPSGHDINVHGMAKMAGFIAALNQPEVRDEAHRAGMPLASDAAFNFAGHRDRASWRLDSLVGSPRQEPVVEEMRHFVRSELMPACRLDEVPGDRLLPPTEYALSPSDFGFHNVLVRPSGQWAFLDFEHAGWDDPAKLVADFFLQPECPLDQGLQEAFLGALQSHRIFAEDLPERVFRLLPLQAVKWTAVILNVFQHASPQDASARLQARLAKAKSYWARRGGSVAGISL